ncbi:MAG: biopolymer transporter ExbD [Bacteroidota bacterium]
MGRPKIPRKSTAIDMTAMCDVAFLLLSFFILTTKFKPAEAIAVTTPSSVASKVAPDKDVVLVTIDPTGKVFLSMGDDKNDLAKKGELADEIMKTKGVTFDKQKFVKAHFWGCSFTQLPAYLNIPEENRKGNLLAGIPADSTKGGNEFGEWIALVKNVYVGSKMNLLLKGDNASKYPAFKSVIDAFKKNDLLKFQMVTNPESIPTGTELWKQSMKGEKREE